MPRCGRPSRIRPRTTILAGSGSSEPDCRWSSPSGRAPSRSPRGSRNSRTPWSRRGGSPPPRPGPPAFGEPEQLAFEAAERYGYPAGFLARYFEKLRYRFGPRERAGLYTFLELARDAGLIETVPELRFVQTTGAAVA